MFLDCNRFCLQLVLSEVLIDCRRQLIAGSRVLGIAAVALVTGTLKPHNIKERFLRECNKERDKDTHTAKERKKERMRFLCVCVCVCVDNLYHVTLHRATASVQWLCATDTQALCGLWMLLKRPTLPLRLLLTLSCEVCLFVTCVFGCFAAPRLLNVF